MIVKVEYPGGACVKHEVKSFSETRKLAHSVKKSGGRVRMKIPASWN